MGNRYHRLIAAISALVLVGSAARADVCAPDRVAVIGDFGRASFTVDVADDDAERSQGLMHVDQMPRFSGMLFVYPSPRPANFWMRNTLIPLDMIFAGPDGAILTVHPNAVPLDETVIAGGDGVQFVLEINGGMAARLGIEVGDALQHPMITEKPLHGCE